MSKSTRYSRQELFWPGGKAAQAGLRQSRVLIVGCGALGSRAAEEMARAGVGFLRIVDRDVVEWSNLHRQTGYDEADARAATPKPEALAARLKAVNSEVTIEPQARDFNHTNARDLASGVDLILDGTDNLPARFLINDVSYLLGTPWVYAGAIGGAAHVQFFSGTHGPCLRCQIPELPPPGTLATCDTAGIVGPAAGVAASWQAVLALRYLTGSPAEDLAGKKALLEPWENWARVVNVLADPECRVCALRELDALEGSAADHVTTLCGRQAVQVLPAAGEEGRVHLADLARRLRPLGRVEERPRYLRLEATEGYRLTLFEDGRALFDGLTDPVQARSLYARLVGR